MRHIRVIVLFLLQLLLFFSPVVARAQEVHFSTDANNDQKVDGKDYVIWVKNFGKPTTNGSLDGDFNGDGTVDESDFNLWFEIYKKSLPLSLGARTGLRTEKEESLISTKASQVAGYTTAREQQFKTSGFNFNNFWSNLVDSAKRSFGKIWSGPKVISYEKARKYVGKEKTVEGEVKEVLNNRKAVYLGFKKPHNGEFVVKIMSEGWSNFPDIPDKIYNEGQKIRVTGKIEWYQGDPVIYVKEPSQIKVLER